jgi:type I restriction-modification system DNA methylase subunit
MASILVDKPVSNVTCYDPAAGSGTLLMNLAHAIGKTAAQFIPRIFHRNHQVC